MPTIRDARNIPDFPAIREFLHATQSLARSLQRRSEKRMTDREIRGFAAAQRADLGIYEGANDQARDFSTRS